MKSVITITSLSLILSIPLLSYGQWEIFNEGVEYDARSIDFINRFMVVSDIHHYSPSSDLKETLLYEFTMAAIEEEVDFVFIPGDLIIRRSDDPETQDGLLKDWLFVLDTLQHHNIRLYACRGNNDAGSGPAWDSLFSGMYQFPQNGPENEKSRTYAIEYDNMLFFAFDLYTNYHKVNQVWLDSVLASTSTDHIFAAGHEPAFQIYQSGLGIYPEERNLFWESLTDAGAKAYFSGHAHFYDHAVMDEGDGIADNDLHQVVVGTGSHIHPNAEYTGDNGRWTPQRQFHDSVNGYVLVEINGEDATMTWKRRSAPGVFEFGGDSFTFSREPTAVYMKDLESKNSNPEKVLHCYPNPFKYSTTISYWLKANSHAEMKVYDIMGRKVSILLSKAKPSGTYVVTWNAEGLPPGIYFCEIIYNKRKEVIKLIKSD